MEDVLHHLAQAAAVILMLELFIVLIIFMAVAGGMAFGLRWVRGKTAWAFGQAETYLNRGSGYVHTGLDYAAKPFLLGGRVAGTVSGTLDAVRIEVRRSRGVGQATPAAPEAARPPMAPSAEPVEAAVPPAP